MAVETGANVKDTVLFERLFLAALAVLARVRTVLADRVATPSGTARWAAAAGRSPASIGAAARRWRAALNTLVRTRDRASGAPRRSATPSGRVASTRARVAGGHRSAVARSIQVGGSRGTVTTAAAGARCDLSYLAWRTVNPRGAG